MNVKESLNDLFEVGRYIGLRDNATCSPPEHLPRKIEAAFKEGAACYSIACYNPTGTMFRLCLDFASAPRLPDVSDTDVAQPTKYQRSNLGARPKWLFEQDFLPVALKDLAACIREDGNDGAHAGTLTKSEADYILDFTTVLLERMYTEPKKLELAEQRRLQ
jgi:hypothetical protein